MEIFKRVATLIRFKGSPRRDGVLTFKSVDQNSGSYYGKREFSFSAGISKLFKYPNAQRRIIVRVHENGECERQ